MNILIWIQKHIVQSILIGMVIGFITGLLVNTEALRALVVPLSFLMVYPMMVTLDFKRLFEKGNVKLQLVTQMINFLYLPFLALLFGYVFFRTNTNYQLAILLIALLPTSGMTVSWTVMAGGNVKEAIRMIVIGLILGGLITPIYIGIFFQTDTHLPFYIIFSQIVLIVFLPMLLAFFTQSLLKKQFGESDFHTRIKPIFPRFSTLAVVVLIAIVMSLRADMLASNPAVIGLIIGPIALGYLVMYGSVQFIGKKLFNRSDRIALINGTMIRSLSLALAIALGVFQEEGTEIALVIALAYIVQVQLAAWFVKREIKLKPVHEE